MHMYIAVSQNKSRLKHFQGHRLRDFHCLVRTYSIENYMCYKLVT